MRYVVRGVLAGAYRGRGEDRTTLTHAGVIQDGDMWPEHTLCRRVKADNLGDENYTVPPTCPLCLERWSRLVAKGTIPQRPIILSGDPVYREFASNASLPRTPARRSFGLPPPAPRRERGALERTRRIAREHQEEERPFDPERPGDWRGSSRDLVVNPGDMPTAEQLRFKHSVSEHVKFDVRKLRWSFSDRQIFLNFINLPPGVGGEGGGAEAQNNRMMFVVRMPQGRGAYAEDVAVPAGSVRVELKVSALPREYRLRTKTAPIEKAGVYVADFLNTVVAEVPAKFTHTKLTENPGGFKEDLAWLVGEYHRKLRTDLSEDELTEQLYEVLTKKRYQDALQEANKLLEGHGVEALGPVNARNGPPYLYINFGDTYDATIMWSRDDRKIFVAKGGWGDVWSEEGEPNLLQDGWDSWLGSEFSEKLTSELEQAAERDVPHRAQRRLDEFESWDSDQQKQLFEKALWKCQQEGSGVGPKYPEVSQESDGIFVHHLDTVVTKAAELVLNGWAPEEHSPNARRRR